MKNLLALAVSVVALAIAVPSVGHENHAPKPAPRALDFPALKDGRSAFAVDLHTHSVFSDGHVWPSIRVEEAQRDALDVLAVTEHLEYQPHAADIPHPDRNRSFVVAQEEYRRRIERNGAPDNLVIINGAEITRQLPYGHINATFLTDANALLTPDAEAAIAAANAQKAFVFFNHQAWPAQRPSGVAELTPEQKSLIARKQIHGAEVVNGDTFSEDVFQFSIDNNLTILGTSDIHGLIDWDYNLAQGEQRSITLVLTKDFTADAIKAALFAGDTVAVFRDQLVGLERNVKAVAESTLRLEIGDYQRNSTVLNVTLHNDAPIDALLRNIGGAGLQNQSDVLAIPAHGSINLQVRNVAAPEGFTMELDMLSAWIAPRKNLRLTLFGAPAK